MKQPSTLSGRNVVAAFAVLVVLIFAGALVTWRLVRDARAVRQRVLYVSAPLGSTRFDVFSMNPDGTDPRNLTGSPDTELDSSWSLDRSRVVFVAVGDPQAEPLRGDVFVMRADGSERRQVTHVEEGVLAMSPGFSPDGKAIVYGRARAMPGAAAVYEVWRVLDDGTEDRRIAAGALPSWSPDGRKLLVTALPTSPGADPVVQVLGEDGAGEALRLGEGPTIMGAWSAEGRRVALLGRGEGGGEAPDVTVVKAEAGAPMEPLTRTKDVFEVGPVWGMDARRVFFTRLSTEEGSARAAVYSVDIKGRDERRLTDPSTMSISGAGSGFLLASRRAPWLR